MRLMELPGGAGIRYWRGSDIKQKHLCFFEVDDLNPLTKIRLVVTPWKLFKFGLVCIWASLTT